MNPVVGADKVARSFVGVFARNLAGRMAEAPIEPAELNGEPALITRFEGRTQALTIAVVDGKIQNVYVIANPDKIRLSLRPALQPTPDTPV